MEFGFTYKGRHTRAFGVTSRTKSRSLLPETKRYVYDAPAKDGSYDFTEANEFDRAFYKDRVFDMTLTVTASSLIELSRKAAKIAAWLTGAGTLVFDDAPLVMWQARAASDVAYTPEKAAHGRSCPLYSRRRRWAARHSRRAAAYASATACRSIPTYRSI